MPHDYPNSGTVIMQQDHRYDYQEPIEGGNYANYVVQANRGAHNDYLRRIADRGNGNRRAPPVTDVERGRTIGGSTVAISVNVQRDLTQAVSPERIAHAIGHSARAGETLWVQNRKSNMRDVSEHRRQHSGIYHGNPMKGKGVGK